MTRPTPTAEGFMPVFTKANTDEKIVAITVDDCFQAENLQQIVDAAIQVGGKLTIFPIGQNAVKQAQSEILKYAWENGFELENHTYTHNGLFACSNEELAEEVYRQQMALSYILGVEYHCHFLRPRGGDARGDQRMQMYAKQMGYYGIAHWSASGSASNTKIAKALEPGAIYLFHTTDTDLEKLVRFIPWVVEQGYQLVTLNEMFGYPANETKPLEGDARDYPVPQLEPYQVVYVPLKKTTYSWETYLLQEKLIAMGYLTGTPDGVYGDGCVAAIKAYQKDHGMEQTGEADADLVRTIVESV
jgi:peptidoglycan/xylan/chitin deacetylase (PgdA/CDA1 family)